MDMIQLKKLNDLGFIPGPNESDEMFLNRVNFVQALGRDPHSLLKGEKMNPLEWEPTLLKLQEVFSFSPNWMVAYYSNENLSFWQGAATWLYESTNKIKFPLIQLKTNFKKGRFLFYSRDEVLLHESLHAIRIAFEESKYEEIFAYSFSEKKWRSFFGPLFRETKHATVFLLTFLISIISHIFSLFFLSSSLLYLFTFLSFLPGLYFLFRLGSLIYDQWILKKALKKIQSLFPKNRHPLSVAFRLTDQEIRAFAKKNIADLKMYMSQQMTSSLRWRALYTES